VNYGVRGRLKSIISLCGGQTCILASILHIFIQMFVIFVCFGCVVINHQKGGDCKENGLRAIWLNRFWCLMINITCGLMCLLVFVFVVHRMLKLLGPGH
jgi:Na+-driven multidrug efflux pump